MTLAPNAPVSYERSRALILLLGLIVLTIIGGTMWVRGVEPVEVSATILFIPLFAAVVFWGLPGGIALAVLASGAYIFIRIPAIQTVGLESMAGVIIARVVGYLTFGIIGGWATTALGASIRKLERFDRTDDETFLDNSRAFVQQVESERARAERHDGRFSVVVVAFEHPDLNKKQRADLMQTLGAHLRANVRSADNISHARDNGNDLFGFVLPETGTDGAEAFIQKLRSALATMIPGDSYYDASSATFPADAARLDLVLDRFRAISLREHPAAL